MNISSKPKASLPPKPNEERSASRLSRVEAALVVGLAVLAFAIAHQTIYLVRGPSMAPTIPDPGLAVVIPTRIAKASRGDVVVLKNAWRRGTLVVKRIAAMPSECMPPGEVDGAMAECQRVEPEHVFVIGDNDPFSADSREFGQIPEAAIVGRVVISIGTNGVTLP